MNAPLNAPEPLIPIARSPLPEVPSSVPGRQVEIQIDGKSVSVSEEATILDAARLLGIDTPTLCFLDNLTPVNVCRVCVVELEGSRVLVPACSRKVESGMRIRTDSERVRSSRRLVLEFLASSVDVSTAPTLQRYMQLYGADPQRFGSAITHAGEPAKIDNEPLRSRLREMYSLLQVCRGLWSGCTEYVCHQRGWARLLRPYCRRV